MNKGFLGTLLISALSLTAGMIYAADSDITVRAEVNKAFVTIGERLVCSVFVRHAPKIKLASSIEFSNSRDFEIKAVSDIPDKQDRGVIITGRNFEIAAYGLGEFVIDEIPVKYLTPDGIEREIKTSRIYVTVQSVDKKNKPKQDIRGIKPPLDLPSDLKKWIMLGGILAVIACVAITAFIFLKVNRPRIEACSAVLSPQEEAYQALRTLFDSSLIREGQVKQYYVRLSEIMRRYLERRYGFAAVEKTTDEIFENLRGIEAEDGVKKVIKDFLRESDIVKFAKYRPEPSEIILINKKATDIVDKTKFIKTAEASQELPAS